MPREITVQKSASLCDRLTASLMPRFFNHWEIEGSTDNWASSMFFFLYYSYFAQATLNLERSLRGSLPVLSSNGPYQEPTLPW